MDANSISVPDASVRTSKRTDHVSDSDTDVLSSHIHPSMLRQLKTESVPLVTVSHSAGQASSFRPRISLLSQQPLSIRARDFQIARAGELPPSSYASQARRATLQSSASQVDVSIITVDEISDAQWRTTQHGTGTSSNPQVYRGTT